MSDLRGELAALDAAIPRGEHGLAAARERSDLFDAAISGLFSEAVARSTAGLVAVAAAGGYGRRRQLPRSDIDLVILIGEGIDEEDVRPLVEALLYPLWDAGLEVGHAVRSVAACEQIATERLDALTSMLDLRHVAGNADLTERARVAVEGVVRADPDAFVRVLQDAAAEREERFGSAAHLLEPDLKEGAGGLRDIGTVGWFAAGTGDDLPLRASERLALDEAEGFLTRVRSALQLETGHRGERLLLEHQVTIAHDLGFTDEPGWIAEDALLRAVFEHSRQVRWTLGNLFRRWPERAPRTDVPAVTDPAGVLDTLAAAAAEGTLHRPELLDAAESVAVPDEVEWTEPVRDAFLRTLRSGSAGIDALETLDRLGLLVRYLPAWREVRCRPQRDPYHHLTVDAHLTTALATMGEYLAGTTDDDTVEPDDPFEHEALRIIAEAGTDHDALLLGALLHDIGKVGEGSHVPIGARIADEALRRMGVAEPIRDLAVFMAAEHLLLPDTATRRDLTDEDLILGVAARIGSPERLAALWLLTRADAVATGPAASTLWRRALIRELTAKVTRTFERGDMGTEVAADLAERSARIRQALVDESEEDIDRFLDRMPRRYLLSVDPEQAARHFTTIAPPLEADEIRVAVSEGSRAGTHELLVVAPDRRGLLSWIAGALALSGLSIRTAEVFTTGEGWAADLFEVEGAFEPEVDETQWSEFREALRGAVDGTISLLDLVARKRAHYPPPTLDIPVSVAFDQDASDFATVIEVGAPDRIGLLYDITRILADLNLDVHLAKVATYNGRVVDAFYVRDDSGSKLAAFTDVEVAFRAGLGS